MVFLRRILSALRLAFSPKPRESEALFLLDLENIVSNLGSNAASFKDVLAEIMHKLGKTARIVKSYAFAPDSTLSTYSDTLRELGFIPVLCPKVIITKDGPKTEPKDTVDPEIIRVGCMDIDKMPRLTHLILASGDKDFISPLINLAKNQGLDIIIVAGSNRSLSRELADTASLGRDGKKMIYILSPEEK